LVRPFGGLRGSNRDEVEAGRGKPLPLQRKFARVSPGVRFYPPTPGGSSDKFEKKGVTKKAVCKCMKINIDFARGHALVLEAVRKALILR